MKVGIINYGMGNLRSVKRALEDLSAEAFVANVPDDLGRAERIILPGVGAFSEGMRRLRDAGWIEPIRNSVAEDGKPLLGICLGMQMLAAYGEEGGINPGLGLVEGSVRRIDLLGCQLRVPHVGWNEVTYSDAGVLFAHIPQHSDFYFVHSYALQVDAQEQAYATTSYGVALVACVRHGHVFGTQFHPEKSSKAGRQLLRNFLDYRPC